MTQRDGAQVGDNLVAVMDRPREIADDETFYGILVAEMFDEDGCLKSRVEVHNLITTTGDIMYAHRGSGISSPPNAPTGMRIGTGSTAVAKTGAGAAIVTKITGGNKAFDATFPSIASNVVTYKTTFGPGEGTTASPVTEAVIVNDTIATDTSTAAANTIARAIIAGVGSKGAGDTLVLTWTHTLTGA
jgi:hypothetical protein